MKILFVAARICYPLNTGAKIRAWHLLRALASEHEVTVVSYYGNADEERHFLRFRDLGVRLVPILHPPIDKGPSVRSLARSLTGDTPPTVAKYYSGSMASALRDICREGFDAVHCEHLHVFPMVAGLGLPVILDAHNVESQIAERIAALERNPAKKALLAWNQRKLLRFEMQAVRDSRLVLAVSGDDRNTFRALGAGDNIEVLENGVDVEYFRPDGTVEDGSIVFVGSMDWKPNIDGVMYFLDEILPLIRRTHPGVTVNIVGKAPPDPVLRRGREGNGINVTGTVDDVRPYVENAAVCIVPLRFGGGTRLKVLEGFAMGKAVVSTTLGCEGITCRDGEHLLIADGATAFAMAVVSLLESRELRKSIGARARRLAELEYDWRALGMKLAGYYKDLFARERCSTGGRT